MQLIPDDSRTEGSELYMMTKPESVKGSSDAIGSVLKLHH